MYISWDKYKYKFLISTLDALESPKIFWSLLNCSHECKGILCWEMRIYIEAFFWIMSAFLESFALKSKRVLKNMNAEF